MNFDRIAELWSQSPVHIATFARIAKLNAGLQLLVSVQHRILLHFVRKHLSLLLKMTVSNHSLHGLGIDESADEFDSIESLSISPPDMLHGFPWGPFWPSTPGC